MKPIKFFLLASALTIAVILTRSYLSDRSKMNMNNESLVNDVGIDEKSKSFLQILGQKNSATKSQETKKKLHSRLPVDHTDIIQNFCVPLTNKEQADFLIKNSNSPAALLGLVALGLDDNEKYLKEAIAKGWDDPKTLELALLMSVSKLFQLPDASLESLAQRLHSLSPNNTLALQMLALDSLIYGDFQKASSLLLESTSSNGTKSISGDIANLIADTLISAGRSKEQSILAGFLNPGTHSDVFFIDKILEKANLSYEGKIDSRNKGLVFPILDAFQTLIETDNLSIMTYNLARIRERELLGHIQRASMVEEFDKRQGTTWIQTNEIAFREFSYLAPISAFVSDSPYIYQSLDVPTRETFINKIEDTGELAAWQWLLLEKPNIFTSEDFPPSGTPFEVWNKKRAGWLKMITYIKENSPQK